MTASIVQVVITARVVVEKLPLEELLARLGGMFEDGPRVPTGAIWTTDALFLEAKVAAVRTSIILAAEMEAAGL